MTDETSDAITAAIERIQPVLIVLSEAATANA